MTDELRRQIAQFVGRNVAAEAANAPTSTSMEVREGPAVIETPAPSNAGDGDAPMRQAQSIGPTSNAEPQKLPDRGQFLQCDNDHIATQCEPERQDRTQSTAKGPHGRALPK